MRILHVFKTFLPETKGGVEQFILQLAHGMQDKGVVSDIFCLSSEGDSEFFFKGLRVYACRRDLNLFSTGFSISAFRRLRHIVDNYDLIHYHFPWPFMDILHLYVGRPRCVVTYHSDVVKQVALYNFYRPLMNRFFDTVQCIVSTSPQYAKSSVVLNEWAHKVEIVPIGLNYNTYPLASSERLSYWRSVVGEGFFLFVGALRYYKGLNYLLKAAEGSGLSIVIAGSGPLERALRSEIRNKMLSSVSMVGSVSEEDKVCLMQLCRAVVFPSHLRSEAFGISLLEGAMYGKPLVCCDIDTGTTFVNRNSCTGIVVPPGDVFALREAMISLCDDDFASRMGAGARARFLEFFQSAKMVDGYFDIYRRCLL